jgi:hypothetical protein
MVLGVTALSMAAVFPEPALLAAQAAVLGLVLVLLAYALRWTIVLREGRRRLLARFPRGIGADSEAAPVPDAGESRMPAATASSSAGSSSSPPSSLLRFPVETQP